ncbi:gamma-glutamyl-gamma-aminobutyrate hydrolase family protein [Streptomyces niveiscabiei]|uniref:Gamma-glutamyl-gamma-aminobutyrate hydrolase family protein n=1 Tax=Streptomyces niveiscabiei TaxID=164115 RepID=A0ABW9HK99_9ACTN
MTRRPLIAVPARFSASASALRHRAEVNARALIEAVWRAGGEPVGLHPHTPADPGELAARLARFDGVLLPGGGDVAPYRYGVTGTHEALYDVDDEQDAFDLGLARHALASGMPLLAVCRGLHVVNTVLGGTLELDMDGHRHVRHPVGLTAGSALARLAGADKVTASCYHHQRVARLGEGLVVSARAGDGTVEGVELGGGAGWFVGVQWHPEDTAEEDAAQGRVFEGFVRACSA